MTYFSGWCPQFCFFTRRRPARVRIKRSLACSHWAFRASQPPRFMTLYPFLSRRNSALSRARRCPATMRLEKPTFGCGTIVESPRHSTLPDNSPTLSWIHSTTVCVGHERAPPPVLTPGPLSSWTKSWVVRSPVHHFAAARCVGDEACLLHVR